MPLWVLFVLLFVAELFTPVFESARAASVPDILADPAAGHRGHRSDPLAAPGQPGDRPGHRRRRRAAHRVAVGADPRRRVVPAVVRTRLVLHEAARRPRWSRRASLGVLVADLRQGWSLLMADRSRRALVLLGWAMAASLVAPEAVALAYVRDQGQPDAWGGILMASVITGAAVGSVYVGRRPPAPAARPRAAARDRGVPAAAGHRHRASAVAARGAVDRLRRGAGVPRARSCRSRRCSRPTSSGAA